MSTQNNFKYFILYKPYGMLCQFSDKEGRPTLSDLGNFPKDVYPVGRLDFDSEGLVLLTNDNELKHRLLEPKFKHLRTYLAQVEKIPNESALDKLRNGILIEGKKTLPAKVKLLKEEPVFPPRSVPIRYRKNVSTSWIELTIYEGRNRQVRKMTAAVGYPTLRLVRIKIGSLSLDKLQPGEIKTLSETEINKLRSDL
jgi:23S rRNA pseudouridine2457 synthase